LAYYFLLKHFLKSFVLSVLILAVVSLSQKIKQKALEIGFHKVGIVRAEPLEKERERLEEWLAQNFHGEMRWMEREPEKRADPQILFPGAKSVVVVALNYFTPHEHEQDEAKGKISRYAWGDDYHDVLKEKLRDLFAFIKLLDETADGKICVDTAPMMDKAWAVHAGLGWIGKHSNLITKEYGSWVFLGEIILNLALEYDTETIEDHCGSCTRCLDACPTGAITAQYLVDSNRCLSYATIELRSPELPLEITKDLNGWLYGCDICQDVCPWNRFEKPTEEQRFEPRKSETSVDLQEILSYSHEEYAARFRKSAMKRAKLGGLKRNAKALLKKSGQK
jgi:epoxyqueuosine reductase